MTQVQSPTQVDDAVVDSEATQERHEHPSELLGPLILGLNDGIVTTLVFVLSVAQASSGRTRTVVLAGLAEMLAGGVSMFLGGFSAARATREAYDYQVDVERGEIHHEPDEERAEVKQMYRDRGFRGSLLEDIVRHVTSDPERWLHVMVRDELGAPPDERGSSLRSGLAIGLSFMAGALIPLFPFFFLTSSATVLAIVLSILALFITGATRSRFSRRRWWFSGGELVLVGLVGSLAGVIIGDVLSYFNA
jgi:VIT1/CCC1 family predicted Fe2+/Mn2+ transporter